MSDTLTHINQLFADSVFQEIRKKRFGLKTCKAVVDAELADDLLNIYKRKCERAACGEVTNLGCLMQDVEERINTL